MVEVACDWSEEKCRETTAKFPPKVQERAQRYLSWKARRSLVASQWALREVLKHLRIPQSELIVCPKGRPFLGSLELEFNLSHSESRAVILFGKGDPLRECLGVDIEWLERSVEKAALAKRFFTDSEHLYSQEHPDNFFRIWTRKEAVLKSNGTGLRIPLNSFEVIKDRVSSGATGVPLSLKTVERPGRYLVSWALPEDWSGSKVRWVEAGSENWLEQFSEGIEP